MTFPAVDERVEIILDAFAHGATRPGTLAMHATIEIGKFIEEMHRTLEQLISLDSGSYGDAENAARARNVSVAGVADAGILHAAAGKVRLLKRNELSNDWDPAGDKRLTVWEATQHLIKRLEEKGEAEAAKLLKALGPIAEAAHALAYRLYLDCNNRGRAEDALAYNGLGAAWPELEKLAQGMSAAPIQDNPLLIDIGPPTASAGKGAPRRGRKKS